MIASLIGFAGNEVVAVFRLRVGREIGSAALVADGQHARIDGFVSLSVFFSALAVYAGFPVADPIIGILITVAILRVVWDTGRQVITRVIDGIDPSIPEEIREWATHVAGVREVSEVRVRWIGHRLHAEVNIAVDPQLSVEAGHAIAKEVRHHLLDHLTYLDNAIIHVDPLSASGEEYHYISGHDY
jgi:cation diffusion facilitator family transporter